MSEPGTLSGRLFQSLGAKYEKVLPPLVDLVICSLFFEDAGQPPSSVLQ